MTREKYLLTGHKNKVDVYFILCFYLLSDAFKMDRQKIRQSGNVRNLIFMVIFFKNEFPLPRYNELGDLNVKRFTQIMIEMNACFEDERDYNVLKEIPCCP